MKKARKSLPSEKPQHGFYGLRGLDTGGLCEKKIVLFMILGSSRLSMSP